MSLSASRRLLSAAAAFPVPQGVGYIGGVWRAAASGATLPVYNPAYAGEPSHPKALIGTVPDMGRADTAAAVAAAKAAAPAWAATTSATRSALLRALHDKMLAHSDALAALVTLEGGKPFEESKGEIAYSASYLEWFAEEAKRAYGDVIPAPRADRRILTIRQPVGVAALLTPWNFSSAMIARKIAPALAAGCTVVIRPSSNTPLSCLALVKLAEECGLPPGVVNVVVGDDHDHIATHLCTHPDVAKLSFTGSTRVGKLLMRHSSSTLKKLSMELGGNAPFIVFEDADVDAAVEGALASKFRNAGQTCVCANRMYVHARVYDEFAAKLCAKVAAMKVGDGMQPGVAIGPLISQAALSKTAAFVAGALAGGAKALTGGKTAATGLPGWFYEPTVLTNVSPDMECVREEIFGPIAPLVSFTDEKEVVERANATDVGLAGYFFTKDLSRAWRVAEALQVGMVGVNTGIISTAVAPFGGVKQSGFGREGSKYGLDEYQYIKYIMMGV